MSERGSFVTEYIYCIKCAEATAGLLLKKNKYLCSTFIPSWINGERLPILAGKIGGLYAGEEINAFESEYIPQLERYLCHELRIAVLAESGERIFIVRPIPAPSVESLGTPPIE